MIRNKMMDFGCKIGSPRRGLNRMIELKEMTKGEVKSINR